MAKKTPAKKPAAAAETSDSIAEQTAAFLKGGGQIEQIASGTSGQSVVTGKKHITLGKKN